jgi:hypothetical protein
LNYPGNLAFDAAGNLLISDINNFRIRVVCYNAVGPFCASATAGNIYTVAGNGTVGYNGEGVAANSAELYKAGGTAFDQLGNLLFADRSNNRVRVQ